VGILGADACAAAADAAAAAPAAAADTAADTACELSSGVSVDDATGTLTIRLGKPDPEFLFVLAGAFAVPASTPLFAVQTPLPVTGPYEVASYRAGRSLVLVRNRYFREWSPAAQPAGFPDRFVFTMDPSFGKHADANAQRSGFDWIDVRGGNLDALRARVGDRLKTPPSLSARYLFLNASVAPFNNLQARQAVSYAVDRTAFVDAWTGPAQITCQVLPPSVPGYRPYCPYTLHATATATWNGPDVARAQRLVQQSGTAGASVAVVTGEYTQAAMQSVVDSMKAIGYQATLDVIPGIGSDPYFEYLDHHPDAQAGTVAWLAGYPSASAFAGVATCAAIATGKNYSHFCDPAVDASIASALALEAQSRAASDAWAGVDRALTDAAPLVPLFVDSNAVLLSARVSHYEVDATGPIYDEAWVR
jgi:peptide/nickel transport system substrate-binding protein